MDREDDHGEEVKGEEEIREKEKGCSGQKEENTESGQEGHEEESQEGGSKAQGSSEKAGSDDASAGARTGSVLAASTRHGRQRQQHLTALAAVLGVAPLVCRRGAAGSGRGVRFFRGLSLRIASRSQHQ
jgi:hypothetical protein